MLHSLLNIGSKDELLGHPIAGNSWEGFVIEQIINNLSGKYNSYFYRTGAGAEVDLVVVKGDKVVLCIEVKLSLSPLPTQGFFNAMQDLHCNNGIVVYPGEETYTIKNNVKIVPLVKLLDFLPV